MTLHYGDVHHGDDLLLRHAGLACQVFALPDDQGPWALYALDAEHRDPRTGERPAVLVAELFADDTLEMTPAWRRLAKPEQLSLLDVGPRAPAASDAEARVREKLATDAALLG